MRAPPILTVVIDLPRVGGVAISCSQICSMQFSKSSATTESGSVAAGAERSFVFALTLEAAGPEGAFLLALLDCSFARFSECLFQSLLYVRAQPKQLVESLAD